MTRGLRSYRAHRRAAGRKGAAPVVVTVGIALLLSSCASPLPEPEPERAPAEPDPVLTVDRLSTILAEIDAELEQGDASLSADELGVRISGMAREVRSAEYLIEAADPARPATELPSDESMIIVPASDDWPRNILVITQPPAESQIPRVLVLNQETARDNYHLVQWSQLLPGVSMPAMALPEQGAAPLDGDADGFVLAPGEVAEAFTDVLNGKKPDDEDSRAGLFGADPLSQEIREELKTLKDGISAVGSVKKTFEAGAEPAAAFEALQGGAIVVTSVREITSFEIDSGSLNVSADTAVLLEKESVDSELETAHDISLVFYIPPADSGEEITILGETRDLVSATGK